MKNILARIAPGLSQATYRRFQIVIAGVLCMTGRITMLGISRWTEEGGSYRTIQRFFNTEIPWPKLQWFLIRRHLMNQSGPILLAGDETTTPKSGNNTFGIGRFFSSIYNRPIRGLSHLVLSVISVETGTAHPVMVVPVLPTEKEEEPAEPSEKEDMVASQEQSGGKEESTAESSEPPVKRGPGRPKGSRDTSRRDVEFTPFQKLLQTAINFVLSLIGKDIVLTYFLYDGALGHNAGLQLVRQTGLHLISKLRHDSALYFPFEGPHAGRGRPKKYGERVDLYNIPECYIKSTEEKGGIRTVIYQITVLNKNFPDPINVVVVIKTNIQTGKSTHILLFSSDLELPWDKMIEYYSLRFQIEFNFRDAKQYWGLDDFMSTNERPVTNAVNLAFFMINLVYLLRQLPEFLGMSVLDLKAWFRAKKYVGETLKLLPEKPEPILIESIMEQVASLGRINSPVKSGAG